MSGVLVYQKHLPPRTAPNQWELKEQAFCPRKLSHRNFVKGMAIYRLAPYLCMQKSVHTHAGGHGVFQAQRVRAQPQHESMESHEIKGTSSTASPATQHVKRVALQGYEQSALVGTSHKPDEPWTILQELGSTIANLEATTF